MAGQNKAKQRIKKISTGILAWYDFVPNKTLLLIGEEGYAFVDMLKTRRLRIVKCDINDLNKKCWCDLYKGYFDYIVSVKDLEKLQKPNKALRLLFELLNDDGKLLLGMNNRLGIRYFCGDRDCYTNHNFDGIEDYRHAYRKFDGIEDYWYAYRKVDDIFYGRMYSYKELSAMLVESGFLKHRFFSVWPDLLAATHLFEQNYIPKEDMSARLFPFYFCPDTVFLEEKGVYNSLVNNGLFFLMANCFFIECSKDNIFSDVLQVTCSADRDDTNAFLTIVHSNDTVEKRALYPDGIGQLQKMHDHCEALKKHNISVVEGDLKGNSYWMPYVNAQIGQVYLRGLLKSDLNTFLRETDKFRDLILQSSEHVSEDKGDGRGVVLKKGYFDMVPLNSFHMNDTFYFFDQEFCIDNYPANALLMRMIVTLYIDNIELEKLYPSSKLMERYDLLRYRTEWQQMERNFVEGLLNKAALADFEVKHRCDRNIVNINRFRMNYSEEKYQTIFVDIFHGIDNRKLFLFGSGKYATVFMAHYKSDYPIYKIVDNNPERWGAKKDGIEIVSPDILKHLQQGEYKIIICIKNYDPIIKQLDDMGITDYSVYDVAREYRQKRAMTQIAFESESIQKKYHIGYIAGVFDLFHVGHLNMFSRAKEQCDYLIVGVVTDRGVREGKKVEPFVPFEERLDMVRSCRYVDEAHEIPFEHPDTDTAWKLYHFDVQFSGSDYEHDPVWLAKKAWLEERGSTMVFFPYTQSTSSTKLKKLITERLI